VPEGRGYEPGIRGDERAVSYHTNAGYTVVSGGGVFKEGAQFLMGHFDRSLKMGVWPVGMIVERDGQKYKVVLSLVEESGRGVKD